MKSNIIIFILVDGNWAEWRDFGICSVTCGGGERSRSRQCNNPSPAHGGLICMLSDESGGGTEETQSKGCGNNPCPGKIISRYSGYPFSVS